MTVLAALRAATAPAHARLEAVMALDTETLSLARYAAALQLLLAARTGWEPELEAIHPGSTGIHRAWLRQDLVHLNRPALPPLPPLGLDAPAAWGLRYVLEGSALGGRVLLRRVEPLGLTAASGARYFAGAGTDTGARWKTFLAALERAGTRDATPGIVRGAVRAFGALTLAASARLDEGLDPRQDLAAPLAAVEDPVMADAGL